MGGGRRAEVVAVRSRQLLLLVGQLRPAPARLARRGSAGDLGGARSRRRSASLVLVAVVVADAISASIGVAPSSRRRRRDRRLDPSSARLVLAPASSPAAGFLAARPSSRRGLLGSAPSSRRAACVGVLLALRSPPPSRHRLVGRCLRHRGVLRASACVAACRFTSRRKIARADPPVASSTGL